MIKFALLLLSVAATVAPPYPSAEEIIERLSPEAERAENAPRTRSLRNLTPVVRAIDMNIQFEFNSAKITAEGSDALQQLAIAMTSDRLASTRFMIEGHTDAKGTVKYNLDLSTRRAKSVVSYLSSQGIKVDRLESVGKGFNELLNEDDPMAAENRRVRIIALPAP